MAIIIGLEEKERVLKSIEDKIKEVAEINAFLSGIAGNDTTVLLSCMDPNKKRHRICINGRQEAIAAFVKEQREDLVSEITALCEVNSIALNEKEQAVLGIVGNAVFEANPYPQSESEKFAESYDRADNDIYEEENNGYSNV